MLKLLAHPPTVCFAALVLSERTAGDLRPGSAMVRAAWCRLSGRSELDLDRGPTRGNFACAPAALFACFPYGAFAGCPAALADLRSRRGRSAALFHCVAGLGRGCDRAPGRRFLLRLDRRVVVDRISRRTVARVHGLDPLDAAADPGDLKQDVRNPVRDLRI